MSYNVPSRLPGANSPSPRVILTVAVSVFFTLTTGSLTDARDILRGGNGFAPANATSNTSNAANAAAAQSAAIAQRANDTLTRTALALQAMQATQTAARAAAIAGPNNLGSNPNNTSQQLPDVSNGLSTSGLLPDSGLASSGQANPVSTWVGASTPVQATINGQTNVTIVQSQQQALLNWQKFDIGKNTTLTFDQSAGGTAVGTWIAFNKINDPSGVPSQILGSIKADGQVYLINQNGIIFGGSSQVNTHALVASSLPINDNLISLGLLNNPESQFLFSSLNIPAVNNGTMPTFSAPAKPNTPNGQQGPVIVQQGAQIESPTTADHIGGRIVLVGPSVTNEGSISTPDGQTIFAAGQQVGFSESTDSALRGLNVFIGTGDGVATNAVGALISAPSADITLAAKNVNQLGYVYSTTSVSYNGRIDLLADYNAKAVAPILTTQSYSFSPTASGLVTLGAGSVTEIVPETWSSEEVARTSLLLNSYIKIEGLGIHLGTNSVIHAPSAQVDINAGKWYYSSGVYIFESTQGQIYLDSGAWIDVSGSENVKIPVTRNIISVQLRGSELADYPVQRNGVLRGQTVMIDARMGTTLADVSGWVGLIERSVGELTTSGGTVSIDAGGSVVMQPESRIDVSGGWINYQGGNIQTTRLISGGYLFNISNAAADLVYNGAYSGFTTTHSKWNVTDTFTSQLLLGAHYEMGYTQGANSGSISITAPGMALDGNLYGNAMMGPRQRSNPPTQGSLTLMFQTNDATSSFFTPILPTPPNVTFQKGVQQQAADPFTWNASNGPAALRSDRLADVFLSPNLVNVDGFGNLTIDNSNDSNDSNANYNNYLATIGSVAARWITLPANVSLSAPVGGSILLTGPNIDIEGRITVASGTISLKALDVSSSAKSIQSQISLTYVASRGNLIVGPKATLTTAGLIVDDRPGAAFAELQPLLKSQDGSVSKGGALSILANNTDLQTGSTIDVSGGLTLAATGKISYGNGGTLTINAANDPNVAYVLGGNLLLHSSISGYGGLQALSLPSSALGNQIPLGANLSYSSGGTGGTLNVQAGMIQVGGSDPNNGTFYVTPDFFSQGGFNSFGLSGIGSETSLGSGTYLPGLIIEPATQINPAVKSRIVFSSSHTADQIVTLPQGSRTPVNLSFTALGAYGTQGILARGDLVISEGASIQTDPRATITLAGDTISFLGSISAPSGIVNLSGAAAFPSKDLSPANALPTVYIGLNANISVAGTTLMIPDSRGYRSATVLNGGSISVTGNIVAAPGSVLDVSGASGILDLPLSYTGVARSLLSLPSKLAVEPIRIDSNGGTISLNGSKELFSEATLIGAAGGPGAQGGSVTISSGRFYAQSMDQSTADINLTVSQSGSWLSTGYLALGSALLGQVAVDLSGTPIPTTAQHGYFAIDSLKSGGFGFVALGGNVEFLGNITLSAGHSLTVAKGGVLSANGQVTLSAPYVTLGQPFLPPTQSADQAFIYTRKTVNGDILSDPVLPTYGTGSLAINASFIDIGNLSLLNIGNAYFFANNGDIRGDGSLDIAGNITLRSGQIYPPTATSFSVTAYNYNDGTPQLGSVTIESSGERPTPLSAGGSLNIFGSIIRQDGVLRAPFGRITLGRIESDASQQGVITQQSVPATQQLTLGAGSITSVSAYDPVTQQWLTIPYGVNPNGTDWVDPKGVIISLSGLPAKNIVTSSTNVTIEQNAMIDIRGGGDIYAYRWVSGVGGSTDILASTSSFAVIPGFESNLAPYAPFSTGASAATNLAGDLGYVSNLKVGDRVYLNGGSALPAGFYTLLPARYALLSGAVLVTPQSGVPTSGTVIKTDGSRLVSGYRSNAFDPIPNQPVYTRFEVASSATIRSRVSYEDYSANTFMKQSAAKSGVTAQRLPMDAGQLLMEASQTLHLNGSVLSNAVSGGQGGLVDISSPLDIVIEGAEAAPKSGALVLDASQLSTFGAESLLIGGMRDTSGVATTVHVKTDNLTVDNSGTALTSPDIILVANKSLTLAAAADIEQSGNVSSPLGTLQIVDSFQLNKSGDAITLPVAGATLTFPNGTSGVNQIISTSAGTITNADGTTATLIANSATSISAGAFITLTNAGSVSFAPGGSSTPIPITLGDGLLLRVSGDSTADIARSNVTTFAVPKMTIGAGARLSGNRLIVDSTYATDLSPTAVLSGNAVSLNSGQISIIFEAAGSAALKAPTSGLVLAGGALQTLMSTANSLSLLSYSSIDIYGSGTVGNSSFQSLALHASDIRGFDGGNVTFYANTILLDNRTGGSIPAPVPGQGSTPSGVLAFNANTLELGINTLNVELYSSVELSASREIIEQNTGGFTTRGDLTLTTPFLTGATQTSGVITAVGTLKLARPITPAGSVSLANLGASLTLQGSSVEINSDIVLPSGMLNLHATGNVDATTGTGGGVTIGNTAPAFIYVGGISKQYYDLTEYTSGGTITLTSDKGNVSIGNGGSLVVDALSSVADAGSISVSAPNGNFLTTGTTSLSAQGGSGGNFSLDVNSLANTAAVDALLNAAAFSQSRNYRVRTGDVTISGTATSHSYSLSADAGAITVSGNINAWGNNGGTISLQALGSVTLKPGSLLSVYGADFSKSGKGGAVSLETRGGNGGTIDIQAGSTIDLRVAKNTTPVVTGSNAANGLLNGTLHLRAPQTTSNTDLQVGKISGSILGASSIAVEGYQVFDLTATGGLITDSSVGSTTQNAGGIVTDPTVDVQTSVKNNGTNFTSNTGTVGSAGTLMDNLIGSTVNAGLESIVSIVPGAEIINRTGDITLGSASSTAAEDWNLATYRFGSKNAPGFLTLRASGNLIFYNALSDGFTSSANTALLLPQNTALPVNAQSWTYRMTAGADFSAVDYHIVQPLASLSSNAGSLLLGKNGGTSLPPGGIGGTTATTASILNPSNGLSLYQVIRTGAGDIDISLGRNLVLLNQFATIYTAGTKVANATTLFAKNDFSLPVLSAPRAPSQGSLGVVQQTYSAQYSMAGGNVSINAQQDMLRQTKISLPSLSGTVPDVERQLPVDWLYRRGYVASTGTFGVIDVHNSLNKVTDPAASTTWWVDFSNFFEGIGALGGGNVTLTAGHDISHIDAAAPTNARMPMGVPNASKLVELGGGNVTIRAGHDIDGGVYYVENGIGTLVAGNAIELNPARVPPRALLSLIRTESWLPTTLFLGKGSFDVSARGDVNLGPVANLFMAPSGLNNMYWNKTYFNTYAKNSSVSVYSLCGDVTLDEAVTISSGVAPIPFLQAWMQQELLLTQTSSSTAAWYQPWLRLDETNVAPFSTLLSVLPPTLNVTSFAADINVVGNLTLYPSSQGSIDLAACGAINGLQSTGATSQLILGQTLNSWAASTIILSDADPSKVYGVATPYSYQTVSNGVPSVANSTDLHFLDLLNVKFTESASILDQQNGSLTYMLSRHEYVSQSATPFLHSGDSNPLHLYALDGDISGLTLFSGKSARIMAGNDITDIAFFIQNLSSTDITAVVAGHDIIAYDPSSALRNIANNTSAGNALAFGQANQTGDIQIAGPGTLEVLAGRDLTLGSGRNANAPSDTNLGIVSIGNLRNPNLTATGADIIAAAGLGNSLGLGNSNIDYADFISTFLDPARAGAFASAYLPAILPQLNLLLPHPLAQDASDAQIWAAFNTELTADQQETLALDAFFLIVRDAGRNYKDSSSPGYGYKSGYSAIAALFPGSAWSGDLTLTTREINTKAGASQTDAHGKPVYYGGNITLLAPGGMLNVGVGSSTTKDDTLKKGVFTEYGGNISIFAKNNVSVGNERIFTLRGGNITIWSTKGNIAAGQSSKTVKSAPPLRVIIDPLSANLKADAGGLSTGGGIGVLASVAGVPAGDVDLVAPIGNIDAGDAGIRSTGNLHVSALQVLNANNIQVSGMSVGTPVVAAAPNFSIASAAANTAAGTTNSGDSVANQSRNQTASQSVQNLPSLITVEVVGYGGGEGDN